jgi:hypothetical protein
VTGARRTQLLDENVAHVHAFRAPLSSPPGRSRSTKGSHAVFEPETTYTTAVAPERTQTCGVTASNERTAADDIARSCEITARQSATANKITRVALGAGERGSARQPKKLNRPRGRVCAERTHSSEKAQVILTLLSP